MEAYLKEQYDVVEDKEHLTHVDEIEDYFRDEGRDYFECGVGFYQDEASVICKIGEKFYLVDLTAEVLGEKRDIGDKLYFVDNIKKVSYKEIEKPKPQETVNVKYDLELTSYQKQELENFMNENFIKF